jgi:hypothetical protein
MFCVGTPKGKIEPFVKGSMVTVYTPLKGLNVAEMLWLPVTPLNV